MATGYLPDGSPAPLCNWGWESPAAQMYSTTDDLSKVCMYTISLWNECRVAIHGLSSVWHYLTYMCLSQGRIHGRLSLALLILELQCENLVEDMVGLSRSKYQWCSQNLCTPFMIAITVSD